MKSFLLTLRNLMLFVADSVAAMAGPRATRGARRALLCRLDRLGDYVVALHGMRALAGHLRLSGYRVVLLAHRDWAALARAESVFDEVWELDPRRFRRDFFYRYAVVARVRRANFSAVYQLRVAKEAWVDDALVRLSGAPERIGPTGIAENQSRGSLRRTERWYTHVVTVDPGIVSERLRNEALMRGLGLSGYRTEIAAPAVTPGSGSARGVPARYCVLVPGGGSEVRRWPADRFAEIARHLEREHGLTPVLVGSPAEASLGESIEREVGTGLVNLVGKIALTELTGLLAGATLVVSNETGPAHLAAALGAATICIAGGGHYGRFVPDEHAASLGLRSLQVVNHAMPCYGCNWRCPYLGHGWALPPCVANIDVERVRAAVDLALAG